MCLRTRAKGYAVAIMLIAIASARAFMTESARAQALWAPGGSPVREGPEDLYGPWAASDGQGGTVITWEDYRALNLDIYAQRVNSLGEIQWDPAGVPICVDGAEQRFTWHVVRAITSDQEGAIMVWADWRNEALFGIDLYAQKVDWEGNTLWRIDGMPACSTEGDQTCAVLTTDMMGGAIVTWEDYRGGDADIYAQKITAGATMWPPNSVPISATTADQIFPKIVSDEAGGAIITWLDNRSGDYHVYAQRVDPDGNRLWEYPPGQYEGVPMCTEPCPRQAPDIVSDGMGGAIIAWIDYRDPTKMHVYALRIDASGERVAGWPENGVRVSPDRMSGDICWTPWVATDLANGAIVGWTNIVVFEESDDCMRWFPFLPQPPCQDIRDADIWAERVLANGQPSWGGVLVCGESSEEWGLMGPVVVSDGAQGAILTWVDLRQSHNIYHLDVYAQSVDEQGTCLWQQNGVPLAAEPYDEALGVVASDGRGGAIVPWSDARTPPPGYEIYAQRINGKILFGSTQYPNGRKLCRIFGSNHLWLAYQHEGRVYAALSTDGGEVWQTWYLEDGGFPTVTVTPPANCFPVVVWTHPETDPTELWCARYVDGQWQTYPLYSPSGEVHLPSVVCDPDRKVHVTWETWPAINQRRLDYGTFLADQWPPVFSPELNLDYSFMLDSMAPCIDVYGAARQPHIVYRKGDRVWYTVKYIAGWLPPEMISHPAHSSSFPFIDIYGENARAVWQAHQTAYPDDQDEVRYGSKLIGFAWGDWRNVSNTPSYESQFPCIAATYACWCEEWPVPLLNWETVKREYPFQEPIVNISQTVAPSKWSHLNYWQRFPEPHLLIFAWTEGAESAPPCTLKIEQSELHHPPVPYCYVETGQEEPSFYCVKRDSFLQFGPEPYQQVDIARTQLVYQLPGLLPWMHYQLMVTGYWQGLDEIRERLDIDGLESRLVKLSPGVPETLSVWIPEAAYKKDQNAMVTVTVVSGKCAVAGPMTLYEFEEGAGEGGSQGATASDLEPKDRILYQNYPNPVHQQTTISYHSPAHSRVLLRIYDVSGRLVQTLVDELREAGYYKATWDGTDNLGRMVANGIYFCRLEAGSLDRTNKIVVLR